jgi:hypothetical protein
LGSLVFAVRANTSREKVVPQDFMSLGQHKEQDDLYNLGTAGTVVVAKRIGGKGEANP